MKRFLALTLADVRFQFRYGFYGIYLIVSLLYILVINLLPLRWRESARVLTVFSDPAALGLFFMGAIILFEKGERVLRTLAVSPVRAGEYILAKLVSLALISTLAATAIFLAGGGMPGFPFFAGVFAGSCLFTLIGLSIGTRIKTLNQFLIATVPAEIAIFVPAILAYFGIGPRWSVLHPGVAIVSLLRTEPSLPLLACGVLAFWIAAAFFATLALVRDLFRDEGPEAIS